MSTVFDTGDPTKFINVDGMVVERDALAIAERLKEIDPDLEIFCINPEASDINDAPFVVAELCPDGQYRRIFECWTLDASVIERVHAARMTGEDLLAKIDAANTAVKLEKERKYKDQQAARVDLMAAVFQSRQSKYSFNDLETGDKVTVYDDRPAEREVAN